MIIEDIIRLHDVPPFTECYDCKQKLKGDGYFVIGRNGIHDLNTYVFTNLCYCCGTLRRIAGETE